MKGIVSIILLTIVLPCKAQTSTDEICKLLLKNEQALVDGIATGDKVLWAKHLHDSCIITTEDGKATTKQKMLKELNPLPAGYIGRIEIIEPNCKIYGNTAVISFVNDEYLELFNQKIHTQYRQSDTWMKINGQWKIVSMQLFEIPKNPLPVTITESVLKQYTGTYQLSAERKCEVYTANGKLYAKKTNREAVELFAETESVFFKKGDGRVNIIFVKNADGTFKMIERREGEDLIWQYVKSK
jgi:Domain of unknown function (DUF4440)